MIDTTNQNPLQLRDDASGIVYFSLPFSRVERIGRLLENHGVQYRLMENLISINDGPEIATIILERGIDSKYVQSLLDQTN